MKYESLGQITSCWVGKDKQGRHNIEENWERVQSDPRTRPERMYSRGAARRAAQVCLKCTWIMLQFTWKEKDWDIMSICIVH